MIKDFLGSPWYANKNPSFQTHSNEKKTLGVKRKSVQRFPKVIEVVLHIPQLFSEVFDPYFVPNTTTIRLCARYNHFNFRKCSEPKKFLQPVSLQQKLCMNPIRKWFPPFSTMMLQLQGVLISFNLCSYTLTEFLVFDLLNVLVSTLTGEVAKKRQLLR